MSKLLSPSIAEQTGTNELEKEDNGNDHKSNENPNSGNDRFRCICRSGYAGRYCQFSLAPKTCADAHRHHGASLSISLGAPIRIDLDGSANDLASTFVDCRIDEAIAAPTVGADPPALSDQGTEGRENSPIIPEVESLVTVVPNNVPVDGVDVRSYDDDPLRSKFFPIAYRWDFFMWDPTHHFQILLSHFEKSDVFIRNLKFFCLGWGFHLFLFHPLLSL